MNSILRKTLNLCRSLNFMLIVYISLSVLSYFYPTRFVLEGIFLIICFVLIGFHLFLYTLIFSCFYGIFYGPDDGLASLSIVYYIVMSKVLLGRIQFQPPNFLVLLSSLTISIAFLIKSFFESLMRPQGFFNSPLSASYFFACIFLLLFIRKNFLTSLFSLVSLTLPGSRAGAILVMLVHSRFKLFIKIFSLLSLPLMLVFGSLFEIRALSFHATSDGRRFESWLKILDFDLNFTQFVFGLGRSSLGSLGQSLGNLSTVSVESSFIGIFLSYGLLGGFFLIFLIFCFVARNSVYWWLFFVVCCVSVIMDSLAISLIILATLRLTLDPTQYNNSAKV